MSPFLDPPLGAPAGDAGELARIKADIKTAGDELASLNRQLQSARVRLDETAAAQLVEANEQLVLAMLAAHRAAEASAQTIKEMADAAQKDPLTGLPAADVLCARLTQAVAVAAQGDRNVALLLLSLADFELINDTLGNAIGDQVLKLAASNLAATVGSAGTVSRHRGREFLVLLPDLADVADAVEHAAVIAAALGAPMMLKGHVLRLTANVGISAYPQDGADPDSLIDRAVAAMYRAKWRGLGSYAFQGEAGSTKRSLELRTLESLRQPLIGHDQAAQESDRQHALLQQANTQLVLAAISAQELQAAAEQAQQRQASFLGMLAHELRNPLAPLSNAAALLGRIPSEGPMLAKIQGIIERQVKNMSRLVGDLLDVTRVSAGKLRLEKQPVDLNRLIDDAVEACRPTMDTRLQRFAVQLPLSAIQVHGDPLRLTQILTNLLDNASKYTPPQGEIHFSSELAGDEVRLTVTDNGIGITPEALNTIFNPFVQEQHATLFNGAGLGIGLTVVRELVEGHGGRVTVSSEGQGRGSQFIVTLPLAPKPQPAVSRN